MGNKRVGEQEIIGVFSAEKEGDTTYINKHAKGGLYPECGRPFATRDGFERHYERRHMNADN